MAKAKVLEKSGLSAGGTYKNRRGNYTILSINSDVMEVRYEDGGKASLSKTVQERILKNTEQEARIVEQIKFEETHSINPPKNVEELICFFCRLDPDNPLEKCKKPCQNPQVEVNTQPKSSHMTAWTEKKVKALEEMSAEELKAEIARLEAL